LDDVLGRRIINQFVQADESEEVLDIGILEGTTDFCSAVSVG